MRAFVAVMLLSLVPAILPAQSIRGVIVDRADMPLAGVVILLIGNSGSTAARALSNERGEFHLATPSAGSYRLRTLRVGFLPFTSGPIMLLSDQELTQRFVLRDVLFSLDTVRVVGRTACHLSTDSSAATFAVWEQVGTVLAATQLTASERAITATTVAFERSIDPYFQRVRRQSAAIHSALVSEPWRSRSPDSLRAGGYVVTQSDTTTYYAPGLDALLSRSFLEDHCFHLTSSPDTTRVGIAFEPSHERRHLADIRGTLWLDRKTSELRRLEFRYVNVSREQEQRAGGDMDFARMRNGMWAISRWSIRMPVLAQRTQSALLQAEPIVVETSIASGELSLVTRGRDTLWSRRPLVLAGTVTDSASGAVVPGAYVTLVGTRLGAVADSAGHFAIPGVLPGAYAAEVRTRTLDEIDAVNRSRLAFTDSASPVYIRIPSPQQIRKSLCGVLRTPMDGIVLGSVVVRGDTTPPAGMRVFAEWSESGVNYAAPVAASADRWLEARTDRTGRYWLCGVPVNTALRVRAVADGVSTEPVPLIVFSGAIGRADLTVDKLDRKQPR